MFATFVLPPSARELANRLKKREMANALKSHGKGPEALDHAESARIAKGAMRAIRSRFAESSDWVRRAKSESIYDGFLMNAELDSAVAALKEAFAKALGGNLGLAGGSATEREQTEGAGRK